MQNPYEITARQLRALNVNLRGRKFIMIDNDTLRVHRAGKISKSIDIRYNRGTDLYDIQAHTIRGLRVKTKKMPGLGMENLPNLWDMKYI